MNDISFIINNLGEDSPNHDHSVVPPLIQSSNFHFNTIAAFTQALANEKDIPIYSRGNNPTVSLLAQKIAALENAQDCLLFGSGSAAIASAIMSQVKTGDHVICVQSPYSWTYKLLTELLNRFKVEVSFVDGTDINAITGALKENTTLLVLESPNTIYFDLQDLEACAVFAHKNNITTVIDNSYSSPLGQNPINFGIDLVCHSATKYLNGHSDVVAGAVCGSKEKINQIFYSEFMTLGGILSPFNAWLLLRGLRTLPIRLEAIGRTTYAVVEHLSTHAKIAKIHYPHHKSHAQYELAQRQMSHNTGLFSVELATSDMAKISTFCESLKRFKMAVSWGGYDSLILPTCIFRTATAQPVNLVRISIGLEPAGELIADLDQALGVI